MLDPVIQASTCAAIAQVYALNVGSHRRRFRKIAFPGGFVAKPKQETVSVSFHFLTRSSKKGDASAADTPFTQLEFDALFTALNSKPAIDLTKPSAADRVRYRLEAPIEKVTRHDARTITGTFKGAYSGHAYDNTAKGRIPANSISLRPFHFLLYLSDSGRIYIGCQYLGQFGGYTGLQRTVSDAIAKREGIESHSFRLGGAHYKGAVPKEVHVSFSDRSGSIAKGNKFGKRGIIVFTRDGNEGFEDAVSKRLFPHLGKSKGDMKKAVAELISESELLEVKDADIEDCTVIAAVNGRKTVINMIESGSFATRFALDVGVNADGHPEYEPTRLAMLSKLKDEIISRKENV